jgi:hypothetical protein
VPANRANAGGCPGDEQSARSAVDGPVTACGEQPKDGQYRKQDARGACERRAARAACLGNERSHREKHQYLHQKRGAATDVVAAVQLVMQGSVGPRDPYQREHHSELSEPAPGQVPRKVVGGLGNRRNDGQVIEEFERANRTLEGLLAVRSRRLPQTAAPHRQRGLRATASSSCPGGGPASYPDATDCGGSSGIHFTPLPHPTGRGTP